MFEIVIIAIASIYIFDFIRKSNLSEEERSLEKLNDDLDVLLRRKMLAEQVKRKQDSLKRETK